MLAMYVLHSLHGQFNVVQYFILFLNSWRDSAFLIFLGRISQSFAPRLETVSLPYLHDLIILLSNQLFFLFNWPSWPVPSDGWVLLYQLSGCGFGSRCRQLIPIVTTAPQFDAALMLWCTSEPSNLSWFQEERGKLVFQLIALFLRLDFELKLRF